MRSHVLSDFEKIKLPCHIGAGAVGSSRYRRPGDDVMLRRVCYHEDGAGSMEMMSCAFRLQDDIMLPRHIGDDVILYFVTLFLIFQIFVKLFKRENN